MVCHSTHSDNCLYRGVVPEMVRRKTITLAKLKTRKKRIKDKFLNLSGRNSRLQIGKVLVGEGLDINFFTIFISSAIERTQPIKSKNALNWALLPSGTLTCHP